MHEQLGFVPPIISAEAQARGVHPTGQCATAGGVVYWFMGNQHALGYDYKARRYRYRSIAGHHIPLRPFAPKPAESAPRAPYRGRNGVASARTA